MYAYDSGQSRALDQAAQAHGVLGFELMRRAGVAAFAQIARRFAQADQLLLLAGKGNNGGDAWVVGGAAVAAGWSVFLWQVDGSVAELAGEAGAARDWAIAQGLTESSVHEGAALPQCLEAIVPDQTVVVDGLLGTGLTSAPRPAVKGAIEWLNESGLPCVALDLPSGISADSGAAPGAVVEADLTITFIGMKLGLLTGQGVACAGEVILEDLGVDADRLAGVANIGRCPVFADPVAALPARGRGAYKNNFGHIVVLAGDSGGGGPPCLQPKRRLEPVQDWCQWALEPSMLLHC